MERRRQVPCPANQKDCKYSPNCFEDIHHVFPKRTAETRLQKNFGNLALNTVLCCRYIHDILDTFPPPDYPDPQIMRDSIERSREPGSKDA